MKRILSILLALTLLIACGCGNTAGNNEQPDNAGNNATQNTVTTPPEVDTDNETPDSGEETPDTGNTDYGDSDYNPTVTGTKPGDTIKDFTVSTFDGKSVTLSEVLQEKDAVLINIFATWCGPCKSEFPFMEQAYKQFQDRVEVIALSGDSTDTSEKIRQVATSLGLTFPMGQDSAGISRDFKVNAFPTTIIVDRFGTIVFFQIGSFPDAASFINIFEYLLSEDYTESVVLDSIPPEMPHLDPLSSEELSAALGEGLVFDNVADRYNWPMTTAEVDGRSVLVTTNQGKDLGASTVYSFVTAAAGDVFAFDFKLSSESGFDFFKLNVNGETVKIFSGEKDWTGYAYRFPADGEYVVQLSYVKDEYTGTGEDTLWLDNARLLSGDDAAAALAANPSYPTAAETSFYITNENVQRVAFEDPYNIVYKIFGAPYQAYLLSGLEVDCVFTLSADVDPEAAVCYDNNENQYIMTELASASGYTFSFTIDSLATTGKGYSYMVLDPDIMSDGEVYPILFFADVEGLEKFVKMFAAGAWHDAEEWEAAQENQNDEPAGDVTYTLRCVDETGAAISGVTLQVCNDSTCSVYVTNESGECVLTLPSDNYDIHVLKAPEGFTFDSGAVINAPIEGGEVTITLTRA